MSALPATLAKRAAGGSPDLEIGLAGIGEASPILEL